MRADVAIEGRALDRRMVGAAVVALLALLSVTAVVVLPGLFSRQPPYDPRSAATAAFEARTGIRLVRVALTGDGGLIDVRYQVLDQTKALETFEEASHPVLVDELTEIRLEETWAGHASHPALHRAVTYFTLLENRGHVIERGGTVTVVMGDALLERVPVG